MKFSVQKTTMWNRIAAALLDFILLLIVFVGVAWGVSALTGYDKYFDAYESGMNSYLHEYGVLEEHQKIGSEEEYRDVTDLPFWEVIKTKEETIASKFNGVDVDVTPEDFNKLSAERKNFYKGNDYKVDYESALNEINTNPEYAEYLLAKEKEKNLYEAEKAFAKDEEMIKAYNMMTNLPLLIITIGFLGGYLILEFILPLIFKNGQTIGKKIFGIAVMHQDGVRVNGMYMFIRTIIGKFTLESMIPVYLIMMIIMQSATIVTLVVLVAIPLLQIILLIRTQYRQPIHDLLAKTITVDIKSQKFFNNEEELLEYKKQQAEEEAEKKKYF